MANLLVDLGEISIKPSDVVYIQDNKDGHFQCSVTIRLNRRESTWAKLKMTKKEVQDKLNSMYLMVG